MDFFQISEASCKDVKERFPVCVVSGSVGEGGMARNIPLPSKDSYFQAFGPKDAIIVRLFWLF